MQSTMQAGLELMLIGISTVFVFLGLLVVLIWSVSWLVRRFDPPLGMVSGPSAPVVSTAAGDETVAAISAAIHRHRNIDKKR